MGAGKGAHPTDGHDSCLVHEVHEVGASKTSRGPRHLVEVNILLHLLVACVHVQNADPPLRGESGLI